MTVACKSTSTLKMNSWQASLYLQFGESLGQTRLLHRRHQGPLVLQKVLYPEGPKTAHGLIIHPPGGIAGGDLLNLQFDLSRHTQVLLTTPGATKWYKSAGRYARQQTEINQHDDSVLEWLPQENIIFDGAEAEMETAVYLSANSVFSSWEINCLGRQSSGEKWEGSQVNQKLIIKREKRLIWHDSISLSSGCALLSAKAGLRGLRVFGSVVVAAGRVPDEIIEACREITLDSNALYGVSALPEVFTARYIGDCSQEARRYFEALWVCLRPWYGKKKAIRPRIWAT